jgi:hypothetical protein
MKQVPDQPSEGVLGTVGDDTPSIGCAALQPAGREHMHFMTAAEQGVNDGLIGRGVKQLRNQEKVSGSLWMPGARGRNRWRGCHLQRLGFAVAVEVTWQIYIAALVISKEAA